MTDSYVQVLPDSTGRKVATQQITRADGSTVAEVQEVVSGAIVSDTPSVLVDGAFASLSLTSEGRLRVSMAQAPTFLNHFGPFGSTGDIKSPWSIPSPWG